jgi:serine/threonine protein kinase
MEHVPNSMPLRRYVISRQLSVQHILSLFREVCDAVAAGHRKGVVHGYLTPNKVLIDPSGSPKVVDYCNFLLTTGGCDSIPPATGSKPSRVDIGYMSPEQYKMPASAIDARADVYSLGAVLYELLTGLPPYDVGNRSFSEAADLIRRTRPISPRRCNEKVSPAVAEMIGDCLKKNRFQRLANAEELVSALDDIVTDRRRAVRRSRSDGLVPASQSESTSKAVSAVALKAQTILSWLVRQIVPLAPQKRSSVLKSTLPWISLLVVGWVFLWIVAEIAREALFPHPVDVDARRTTTQLSAPPR